MKQLIMILLAIFVLSSCAKSNYLAFAPEGKYGKYPVKKNVPVKQKTTWTFKQWGHEGR